MERNGREDKCPVLRPILLISALCLFASLACAYLPYEMEYVLNTTNQSTGNNTSNQSAIPVVPEGYALVNGSNQTQVPQAQYNLSALNYSELNCTSTKSLGAKGLLEAAQRDIQDMRKINAGTDNPTDLFEEATQTYSAQCIYELLGGSPDYSALQAAVEEIHSIRQLAFLTYDELRVFEQELSGLETPDKKLRAEIEGLYRQAQEDFRKERYADARKDLEQAEAKISEARQKNTLTNAIYTAATENVASFLERNWPILLAVAFALSLVLVLGQNQIARYQIRLRINRFRIERETLAGLIERNQREYFEEKKISETTYHIRMNEFNRMVLDINRQIPLLEELYVKKGGKSKGEAYVQSAEMQNLKSYFFPVFGPEEAKQKGKPFFFRQGM